VQRRPPLFHAAIGGHLEVAAFLLDHGASPNLQDQFGDTPLMVACAKGYGDVATLLLQRGADPALEDEEGRTARERAAPGTEACSSPGPKTP
jgi:ankyrin repeat protein